MVDSGSLQNGHPSTFLGQSGTGYKICERLGAGSASVVFKCRSVGRIREDGIMVPVQEECFAVKIIDMKSIYLTRDFSEKKSKLLEEAMILQKLRHPNIVSLVDFSDSGDTFYLVMDLVEGGELFYKIVECGSLSESSARHILRQIVEALSYMHSKEIIHRDLKPENILIQKTYPGDYFRIKVADFGVAKFLRNGYTQARTLVGTPQYWAPEVLNASKTGESYGPEADLWSLGVLFYVMLGGAFPFDERKGDLEQLIREGNYHFRYPRFKRVSNQAKDLIQRLLTVDPGARMTLSELKQDPWMKIRSPDEPILESGNSGKQEIVLFNSHEIEVREGDSLTTKSLGASRSNMGTHIGKCSVASSKTSSIMDINSLLDLQLSVAYKLHGIYIAFRHNSTICRVLQQHIHRWRILQQQSCLAIGKFKQTCESVLDELPDFLLAVNTNEPKLAIELLSHVKNLVDVTQMDVELIQNGYNDFLFELSNFVESIRDIKRITETSSKALSTSAINKSKENLDDLRFDLTEARNDQGSSEHLPSMEDWDFSGLRSNPPSTHRGNLIKNSFDPSIFIGYNSARDKVIRKITDLFASSELNNLLDPQEDQKMSEEDPSSLSIQVHGTNIGKGVGQNQDSSYITTSLASTRDLLFDFLFLPASICNVPPSGVESLLQENLDFGLPNLPSFEISTDKVSASTREFEGINQDDWSVYGFGSGAGSRALSGSGSGLASASALPVSGGNLEVMQSTGEIMNTGIERNSTSSSSGCPSSKTGPERKKGLNVNFNINGVDAGNSIGEAASGTRIGTGSGGPSAIFEQKIKRDENQLKISYILVRVLAQLRMIESILGRCVAFWGNMNITIEKILQLRQHAERLLGFTENPVLRTRFDERVESYREFWQELRDICDSYLHSAQTRQLSLENQVHELLDTASKVDTVFNMNMI
ncbi:putative calcium signaling protein kinase RAD53 [Cryptosporidium felis]|nr:putative calcium signaling protein kinase RAD53 [Cryptosporidium felis]